MMRLVSVWMLVMLGLCSGLRGDDELWFEDKDVFETLSKKPLMEARKGFKTKLVKCDYAEHDDNTLDKPPAGVFEIVRFQGLDTAVERCLDLFPLGDDQPLEPDAGKHQREHAGHCSKQHTPAGPHQGDPKRRLNEDPQEEDR